MAYDPSYKSVEMLPVTIVDEIPAEPGLLSLVLLEMLSARIHTLPDDVVTPHNVAIVTLPETGAAKNVVALLGTLAILSTVPAATLNVPLAGVHTPEALLPTLFAVLPFPIYNWFPL